MIAGLFALHRLCALSAFFMMSFSARREKLEYVPCADGSRGRYLVRANDVVPDLTIAEYQKLAQKIPALTESTFKWELNEANLQKQ